LSTDKIYGHILYMKVFSSRHESTFFVYTALSSSYDHCWIVCLWFVQNGSVTVKNKTILLLNVFFSGPPCIIGRIILGYCRRSPFWQCYSHFWGFFCDFWKKT